MARKPKKQPKPKIAKPPVKPPVVPTARALREWPADKIERRKLDAIIPYPNNARTHSEEQVAQIAASMQAYGVTAPVLVDEEGVLIYGHGRLRGAQLLGLAELPVAVARGWSEDEKRAYRLSDNQLALNAGWDIPLLKLELGELKLAGFDMPLLGFGDKTLITLLDLEDTGETAKPQLEGLRYAVIVRCDSETHQIGIIEQLQAQGLNVEALIS